MSRGRLKDLDKELLVRVIESSTNGIAIADATLEDIPLIYVNPAFEKLTGYNSEEAIGKNCRFLQGDDRDQEALQVLRENIRAGKPCIVKLRNYKKDGTVFWNELSLSPVYDKQQRLTHYIAIQKDISDQEKHRQKVVTYQKILEQTNHELAQLSFYDSLTEIANRRLFEQCLSREWGRAKRTGQVLTLAMFDIDEFKKYNDHYGHQKGDACIKAVASVINSHLRRPTDLAARYGGEEFVALMPETSPENARRIIHDMQADIKALNIEHARADTAPYVTLSAGLASQKPARNETSAVLLASADKLLFAAKAAGRNQVKCQTL